MEGTIDEGSVLEDGVLAFEFIDDSVDQFLGQPSPRSSNLRFYVALFLCNNISSSILTFIRVGTRNCTRGGRRHDRS